MEKNTISLNKKVASKQKQIEVTGDIIVPDSKPDIVNIITTNLNAYIYKEEITENKYRFDGNVDTMIVYLSENGETKSIQTTLDFMDLVEEPFLNENTTVKYSIEIANCDTKVLNERKISVNINLKISFQFFECENMEYSNQLKNMSGVEKLEETINVNMFVASNKVRTSLKEDVTIIEDEDIAEILKSDIFIDNMENKISYNKVLSKADVNIKLMYITVSGNIGITNAKVPIMNFIDMENVTDENTCNTNYKVRNMLFKVNSQNMRNISCQIDFEVCCEVYKKETMNIVQDMYGINKNITFNQKRIEVQTDGMNVSERVNINENILVEDIRSIYDVDCRASLISKVQDGNSTNCEGEIILDICFDTGNKMSIKNAKIPFTAKLACNTDDIEVNFLRKNFRLNNEDVMCDIEIELRTNQNQNKMINIIEDVQEEELEDTNDYAMIVYFVKQGDTIWNIARDFRVSIDSIKSANNLENIENICEGDKIYIVK